METIISPESKVQGLKSENQILAENGFYWRAKRGVKVLVSRVLEEKGFANGFSTRTGGVSDFPENSLNLAGYDEDSAENIAENRRRFLSVFESPENRLARPHYVAGYGDPERRARRSKFGDQRRSAKLVGKLGRKQNSPFNLAHN